LNHPELASGHFYFCFHYSAISEEIGCIVEMVGHIRRFERRKRKFWKKVERKFIFHAAISGYIYSLDTVVPVRDNCFPFRENSDIGFMDKKMFK